jgi:sortase A
VTAQLHLRAAKPVAVTIPHATISMPVVESQIVNGLWQTADHQANFLGSGARPTEGSNTVIYAHNRVGMFRNLHQVAIGDQIIVTNEKNETLSYTAQEIHTVTPDQIEVVLPTDHEQLTLYTCTGWLDRFRLVVVAVPTVAATASAAVTR